MDYDLWRYEGARSNKWFVRLRYFLFTPGYTYIKLFRKASEANNTFVRWFWRIPLRITEYITGIQIPYNTKIDRGFRILHHGTIIINPGAVIGKNFNIAPGCLIGSANGKRQGVPHIGDNVTMTHNSMIIGGVKIGNNVMIAPGAFVNFDVPDNSIVIGNPGKIIPRDESPTKAYIVYPIPEE